MKIKKLPFSELISVAVPRFYGRKVESRTVRLRIFPFAKKKKKKKIHFVRRFRKIAKSDYWLRHVRLSVRMEQLGSHYTDFNEISYLTIFRKSVEKIQVSLK